MADLLSDLGIPQAAVSIETGSSNTSEHAVNLCPMLKERNVQTALLVTSAMHMPRSLGTFRKRCPVVAFIPAPTDFRAADQPIAWSSLVTNLLPTPLTLLNFSDVAHEYLGIAYYRLRGWM